jgi:TonB family protein
MCVYVFKIQEVLMPKSRTIFYLAILCALLCVAAPIWAEEQKAKAPEGNVNIVTEAKKKGLKIVKMVHPVYPPEAKAKGVEGAVKIDVVIDKEGSVTKAEAISGPEVLKAAALEAVRQWKYEPLGVEAHATIHINFKLGPKPPPAEPKPKA